MKKPIKYKILDCLERIFGERPYYSYIQDGNEEYSESFKNIPREYRKKAVRRIGPVSSFYQKFLESLEKIQPGRVIKTQIEFNNDEQNAWKIQMHKYLKSKKVQKERDQLAYLKDKYEKEQ